MDVKTEIDLTKIDCNTLVDTKKRPLSSSSLKQFAKSPLHYCHYLTAPYEPTEPMIFGNIVHVMVLEPDKFKDKYAVMRPGINKRTNDGKAEIAEFIEKNKDKQVISEEQKEKAEKIRDAIFANEKAMILLNQITHTEKRFKWKEKGRDLIGFADAVGENLIVDLKIMADGDFENFSRDCVKFGYYRQAAMYMSAFFRTSGTFPESFYFIVAEKSPPFGVAVHRATKKFLDIGKMDYQYLLDKFNHCEEEQLFNEGYEFHYKKLDYNSLDLPAYFANKFDDQD